MKMKNFNILVCTLLSVMVMVSCIDRKYYALEDFHKVEKIDSHYHIFGENEFSVEQAQKDNFRLLNINLDAEGCEQVRELHERFGVLKKEHPDDFEFTGAFCLEGWDEPGWVENTISWIDRSIADGAIAIKIWKNIGMEFRNKDSVLVMIDDPQFDPVFRYMSEKGIPVVGHLGEPKNCWLPLEEMTVKNDKSYFRDNPQYHMYLHPEFPSYEEQIAARDRMLEKNPELVFIGCHFASLEWSVDEMAAFLERFPNAAMDMSARIVHLFHQTVSNCEKVRDFIIKYQDRLLYGTDLIDWGNDKNAFQQKLHNEWMRDWEYFVTDNKMVSESIEGEFRGLKLPKNVVDKIYAGNVKRWYKFQ